MLLAATLLLSFASQAGPSVFLRVGPKTHGEGQHDHPRFLAEWTRLLTQRGCRVQGGLAFPSAAELAASDVLVLYAADGAAIHGDERVRLEQFLGRGGGLVVLHDALCGDDPLWFQGIAGGAWEHGRSKYLEGEIGLVFADHEHPLTKGVANFDFRDEIYWDLHLDPRAHVLASSFHTPFDVTPQMWTFEPGSYRAFVALQGHEFASFAHPAWRTLLLRGIAWAAGREVDCLVTPEEVADLRYPRGGPRAPEQAADTLVLHPDFELSLVAAEPLVVNPISLDWDARGRMWVALTPGYPDKQEFSGVAARDEVVILGDADGDGRMDQRTVFAQGLDLVTSLVLHGDGAIVAQSPEILWLRDRDGDDRADERVVLYSGFGYGDTHAVVSNLRWGLDGWIYATQGYSGNDSRHVTGLDDTGKGDTAKGGTDHGSIGNGLFRFRPDGSAIEMVSAYGSNTWGLDFTWDGELFFSMANGSHLRHVVLPERQLALGRFGSTESWFDASDHQRVFPLRTHERPPYQQIDFVGAFTGASGACVYTGGAWPEEFAGGPESGFAASSFVCEPTVNLVHHDRLVPRGMSFTATKAREAEFLASTDLWFRPVHLRVGPDGALYLLDFYNQAAVHNDTRGPQHGPTNAAVRPDRDHEHGRIWRIQHRLARTTAVPRLDDAPQPQLVRALEHPNGQVRDTARRLLCEAKTLEPASTRMLAQAALGAETPAGRVQALWVLTRRAPETLIEVAQAKRRDPDPGVRKNLLAALETLDSWTLARVIQRPQTLLGEADARTRLAGLRLLARLGPESLLDELIELSLASEDDWSRSVVLAIALARPARFVGAALQRPMAESTERLLTELARNLARRGALGDAVEAVTTLAERGARSSGVGASMLAELARGLAEDQRPWPSPRLDGALIRLLRSPRAEIALAALPLSARWSQSRKVADEREALGERLAETVQDEERTLELRLTALASMLSLPGRRAAGLELAAGFLGPLHPLEVQQRVIDALGAWPEAAATLCASFGRLSQPARERALGVLLARPASTGVLLERLAANEIRAPELGPQGLHRLRNHPDPASAVRATTLLAELVGGEREDKNALLAELLPLVDRPGNAARGREVFGQNCGNCHTARGSDARGRVGPDLTGMGAHGARELLPFLIDPNRAVEPAFLEYVVETTDGELLDGVIARETPQALLLRNSAGEREVPRSRISELRSTGRSPMPTGFESLGAEALCDLIAFLAGEWAGFRVVDLRTVCSSSTSRGLYDTRHDAHPMRFRQHGVVGVEGVPFELLDPARMDEEKNTLTLRGGLAEGWQSHEYPQRVELPLGYALTRLHVLGGIAAWGYPYTGERSPAVKLTWNYAGGEHEEHVLTDGIEFADWIGRHEVPGSKWVDVLAQDSWGQLRTFSVEPGHPERVVDSLTLESYDNHLAPTFVALTAQLEGANPIAKESHELPRVQVLVFGGGSSHDFGRWFRDGDGKTLAGLGKSVAYSESPEELGRVLAEPGPLEVLVLCNNQPLTDPALRAALFAHVEHGGGLVLLHAATWYNWADWPEYNRELVGGGARGHESYGEFGVRIVGEHPVTRSVARSFSLSDELYRFEPDPEANNEVLAIGRSLTTGAEFPVLWTRTHGKGRIVALTLGHDGAAHEHAAYRALLANAVAWVSGP